MADIELVIKIDEYTYKQIKEYYENNDIVEATYSYIYFGIPLPKGHGELIDIDNIQEITLEDSLTILTHTKGDEVDWYIDAPTIIEADKGE